MLVAHAGIATSRSRTNEADMTTELDTRKHAAPTPPHVRSRPARQAAPPPGRPSSDQRGSGRADACRWSRCRPARLRCPRSQFQPRPRKRPSERSIIRSCVWRALSVTSESMQGRPRRCSAAVRSSSSTRRGAAVSAARATSGETRAAAARGDARAARAPHALRQAVFGRSRPHRRSPVARARLARARTRARVPISVPAVRDPQTALARAGPSR